MHINTVWQDIDTVLLDTDNTLFDLAFDNYFQQKLVPETWGVKNGVTPQEAMEYTRQQYHDVQHTLNWYRLGYWSEQLGLDICVMITEMGPRVALREDTISLLEALKVGGKQQTLLTNTYPHSLVVKLEHTGLDVHLDLLLSTHIFDYSREDQRLWHAVAEAMNLKAERTLFIDDNETILDATA